MSKPEYLFLDDKEEIIEAINEVSKSGEIAIDLEADGLFSYEDKVCLVQIAGGGKNYVLDPLVNGGTMEALKGVLENPRVRKLFHGGDYDIRLLKKDCNIKTVNVFDTMIASQLLGREQIGLAALLESHFAIKANKKFQKANWAARPLTEEMLDYAALDVAYLHEIAAKLEAELDEKGRTGWAKEEFEYLEGAEPPEEKGVSCFNIKGAGKLAPRELGILQGLLEVRDEIAREWNRPPFKVISNAVLLAWAVDPPKSRKRVIETKGASVKILAKLAGKILESIKATQDMPLSGMPQRPKLESRPPLTPDEKKLVQKFKKARAAKAEELGIEPGIIVNTATLENLARKSCDEGLAYLETALKKWQFEVIGDTLIATFEL